jgi:hypothetical protein
MLVDQMLNVTLLLILHFVIVNLASKVTPSLDVRKNKKLFMLNEILVIQILAVKMLNVQNITELLNVLVFRHIVVTLILLVAVLNAFLVMNVHQIRLASINIVAIHVLVYVVLMLNAQLLIMFLHVDALKDTMVMLSLVVAEMFKFMFHQLNRILVIHPHVDLIVFVVLLKVDQLAHANKVTLVLHRNADQNASSTLNVI